MRFDGGRPRREINRVLPMGNTGNASLVRIADQIAPFAKTDDCYIIMSTNIFSSKIPVQASDFSLEIMVGNTADQAYKVILQVDLPLPLRARPCDQKKVFSLTIYSFQCACPVVNLINIVAMHICLQCPNIHISTIYEFFVVKQEKPVGSDLSWVNENSTEKLKLYSKEGSTS